MRVILVFLFSFLINGSFLGAEEEKLVHHLQWSEVDNLVSTLAETCKNQPCEWKGILIISRGGLVPGGILAEKLGVKNIRIICLASYKGQVKGEMKVIHMPNDIDAKGKNWIVVDDLTDSGATLKYVKGLYPDAFYVTLIAKPQGKELAVSATEFPQDTWISFPWEK